MDHQHDFYMADEVFIKQVILKRGTGVQQHSHVYDHTSMVAMGTIRVMIGDEVLGDFKAPCGILIRARIMHKMIALEDSIFYCIHNTHSIPEELLEQELTHVRT